MSEEDAAQILGLDIAGMPRWTQGLLIADTARADTPVIFASKGFTTLTGYAEDEVAGRNCRFLQGADTDRRTVAAIREAVAARRRFDGDILNYRKDGTPFWNRLSIGPVTTGASEALMVGLQFDVTDKHSKD